MFNNGAVEFFGFTNFTQPSAVPSEFNDELNLYVNYSGWTNGELPMIVTSIVPQSTGGVDSYGNPIVAYNFETVEIPIGTVDANAWYTWIIPVSLTNNETQTMIDINTNNSPNLMTAVSTEGTINSYTFTYSGTTIPKTTYKVYTTFPNTIFQINNSQNIYFKGNTISP
jgi:hypothetical protein